MRIVELSFNNLNSLVGHWRIDLTHPEFARDGIFAITGPTGAGKTTILDAICLGLYGTTPRLGKVGGKAGNDLMSRHNGECDARIIFETASGRYVSHWAQHRARRKASGDLQPPRHEVSDARTGKILASTVKDSAALILELTGMSFEQFSRSMMLAQGAFAAFLQARSEERAPILEQITGSEIYSQISIIVHERRGQERERLADLRARLEGTQVLSEPDRTALQTEIVQLDRQAQAVLTQQRAVQARLQAVQQLEQTRERIKANEERAHALAQNQASFEPDRLRLQAARRTQDIVPEFRELQVARQDQVTDQTALIDSEKMLPAMVQSVQTAQDALAKCEQAWAQQRIHLEQLQPKLEQTRHLDVQITQNREQHNLYSRSLLESEQGLQSLQRQKQELCARLDAAKALLEDLNQKMAQASVDAELVTELSGFRQGLAALSELDQQMIGDQQQVQNCRLAQDGAQTRHQQVQIKLEQELQTQTVLQERLDRLRNDLAACLQNRSLTDWQTIHGQLLSRRRVCEQALERDAEMTRLKVAIERDRLALDEARVRMAQLDLSIRQIETERDLRMEQREGLQEQLLLHRKIEDYEQARAHLHTGEPCPLCGSLEHPFAQAVTTDSESVLQRLRVSELELERVSQALTNHQIERSKISQEFAYLQQTLSAGADSLIRYQSEQPALFAELQVEQASGEQSACQLLKSLDTQLQEQIRDVVARIQRAGELASSVQELELQSRQAVQLSELARAELLKAEQACSSAQFHLDQALTALDDHKRQREARALELVARLARYGIESGALGQVEQVTEILTTRRDQWLQLQQSFQQAQQACPKLEQSIDFVQESLDRKAGECQTVRDRLTQSSRQTEALAAQRRALLEDLDPVQVGKSLATAIEQARQTVERAREQLTHQQSQHQQQSNRISAIKETLDKRAQRITALNQRVQVLLTQHGFEDETALVDALLTDEQRKALEAKERVLLQEQSVIESAAKELQADLQALLERVQTGDELVDLKLQIEAFEQRYRQDSEALGALRQRMADDDRAKKEYASQLVQIDAQNLEHERWNALHALIGSADGKKFRTFAQGLTFEIVIQHANQQLQRMTDRYLLIRGVQEPLELNVVDQYQAAEVRTTKNLSGGESFLVSLALALGLSKMASRNVRVDSLFLDEGFGTLDEDALEMALQTLSSLHQEGKLIGVISHVQALKDRIATQIQVAPLRGGRSALYGPGCEAVGQ